MSNKLKDIFSYKQPEYSLTFHFQDLEKDIQFRKSLEKVHNEGKTVGVDGIKSINVSIKNGNESFPLESYENIINVNIGLNKKEYSMVVSTKYGEKEVLFVVYRIQKNVILELGEKSFVFLKFTSTDGNTFKFFYRLQFENAKDTSKALEDLYNAIGVINRVFKSEDENSDMSESESIVGIREMFLLMAQYLEKLFAIEKELKIKFDLTGVTDFREEIMDIDELYCLIVKKEAIRLNAKSVSTEAIRSKSINVLDELVVGKGIELFFLRENKYSTCGRDICIYTANLLTNAVIKEIQNDENDQITVLYGDLDSKPMYISYTGYKTEIEAQNEIQQIMKDKDRYINALTMLEHLQKMNIEY